MFPQPIPFGKYYLLERVNVGGMAEVFKAKTFGVEGFERLLAIKRILPNIAEDGEFIEMFVDEAKIAVELHHANIAQIYDLGRIDGSYFIAMEYIHGKDMRAIFDRSRKFGESTPIPMACYLVMKICEGIDYAHNKRDGDGREMNLVHRDISPQNILVSYEGEVKIIDFGIAKAANKASKTQAGILKGKFGYMSPEQVRGLPLDRRSDIFSVGIVLYELLTGERLFLGESDFSTLEKVRNVEIMPPTLHNPKIPEELESIVFKALAKNVDERYEHAIDLHDDLQRFLYGMNSFFSRKDLAQYMKRAFSEELARENAQIDAYRKMQPPSMGGGNYGADLNGYGNQGSLADAFASAAQPSRRNPTPPPAPVSGQMQALSRRNPATPTPVPVQPPNAPSRRTPPIGVAPQNDLSPQNAFSSGFVGSLPPPRTGNTQVVSEADLVEEDHSQNQRDSFFASARSAQHAEPDILDEIAKKLPPRPIPPHLPPPNPSMGELLAPDAIPPMTNLPNRKAMEQGKIFGFVALGLVAVGLVIGAYLLFFSGKPKGTLLISTNPTDARVYIDNEKQEAASPLSLLLPVGLHTIKAVHNDYDTATQDVEVIEGKVQKVQLTLKPKESSANAAGDPNRGSLYIDSEPPGAQIFVDGVPQPNKTPTVVDGLSVGAHSVKVVAANPALSPFFLPAVEVKAGSVQPVKAKFDVARGTLIVNSIPDGADVSVLIPKEKPQKGNTPATFNDLPLGVELEVYVSKGKNLTGAKNVTLEGTDPLEVTVGLSEPGKPAPKTPDPKNPKNPDPKNPDPKNPDPKNPDPKNPDPNPKNPDPPVETSTGPGFLTANAKPQGAECTIDGNPCQLPVIKMSLKAGKHTIRLKLKNDIYDFDEKFTIEIKSGEETKFIKKFDPKTPAP